jgi:hypothetical protein
VTILRPEDAYTKPPSATISPQPKGEFALFAKKWEAHGAFLTISGDGHGEFFYRLYEGCGSKGPPCDRVTADGIDPGGRATFQLFSRAGVVARGRIVTTNVPAAVPAGPITVRVDPRRDVLQLETPPTEELPSITDQFCGPRASIGEC